MSKEPENAEAFGEIGNDGWRKIAKPAKVGSVHFSSGISARMVVEAAQRHHEYSVEPEVEAERLERICSFVAAVREGQHPEQAEGAQGEREAFEAHFGPFSWGESDFEAEQAGWQARAALAQPSPAPELERPSVTGWLVPISGMYQFFRTETEALAERAEYLSSFEPEPVDLEPVPEAQMSVAQHHRIVDAYWKRAIRLMGEHVASVSKKLEQERDAALAKLAAMEQQEPVGEFRESEYDGEAAFYWIDAIPPLGTKLYAAPVAQAGHVPDIHEILRLVELLGEVACAAFRAADDSEERQRQIDGEIEHMVDEANFRALSSALDACDEEPGIDDVYFRDGWLTVLDKLRKLLAAAPQPAKGE